MKKSGHIFALLGILALAACSSDNRGVEEEQRMEDVSTEQSVDESFEQTNDTMIEDSGMQEEEAVIEEYEDAPAMDDAGQMDSPEAQEDLEEYNDPSSSDLESSPEDDSLGY